MRAAWAAATSAALAIGLASGGCYKPSINTGGFQCGPAPGNACPDGFRCDTSRTPPLCVNGSAGGHGGGAAGAGGKGGSGTGGHATGGAGGQGGQGAVGGAGGVACWAPVASCTSNYVDGGACDPVCNVGCPACTQKCSVNMAGAMTCNPNPQGVPTVGPLQSCLVNQPTGDMATQTDNCMPGHVCIGPTTCGTLCYQFCRTDADCSSKNCGRSIGNGLKVCDVAPSACDPLDTNAVCNPVSNSTRCYVSGTTEKTLCDCGNAVQGRAKDPCTTSRDCYPGLVCYNPTGIISDTLCRRLCRLPTDAGAPDAVSTCQGGAANCMPMLLTGNKMSTTWGYCNE